MRSSQHYTIAILGAGPGGIQLAYYLQQSSVDYIVLEQSRSAASFYSQYPRRRDLISFNRVNTLFEDPRIKLRFDWNSLLTDDHSFPFSNFSRKLYPKADDLVRYLNSFAQHFNLNISYSNNVQKISKLADLSFKLVSDGSPNEVTCDKLVVASGFRKSYNPPIPGLELCEGYSDVSIDPEAFEGQRVFIIGKGNSAFEIADIALESCSLLHIASPNPIKLAWNSRHPGHVRANHTRLLDSYQLKLLNGTLDCHILSIKKNSNGEFVVLVSYVHADGETEELVYDRVVNCAGFSFDSSVFDNSCTPTTLLNGKLPAITPFWESVNVKGMFFAGTLMQARDFKKSSSAFIGGFRYNIRSLAKKLVSDISMFDFPCVEMRWTSSDVLANAILDRCNTTSGLWAQFKYLCDVIVIKKSTVNWYEEMPLQFVEEGGFGEAEEYFTLAFEWGEWSGDVMAIERHPTAEKAYTNVFLHPILRYYNRSRLVSVHHILEDLFGNYSADAERGNVLSRGGLDIEMYHLRQHFRPLAEFILGTVSILEEQPDSQCNQPIGGADACPLAWDG